MLGPMSKAAIVMEIVTLLQGTPVGDFARANLAADGNRVIVRCAEGRTVESAEGRACKSYIATALRRFSYRFTMAQLEVLVELYVSALEQLEPEAIPRVRYHMCDAASEAAQRDAAAALAACERLSLDF